MRIEVWYPPPPPDVPISTDRVPGQLLDVEEDAHQLGDGQRGVRVVQLDGHLVRELLERGPLGAVPGRLEPPHDILPGARARVKHSEIHRNTQTRVKNTQTESTGPTTRRRLHHSAPPPLSSSL